MKNKDRPYCTLCQLKRVEHNHHVIPISIGGMDIPENKNQLCHACHSRLHSMFLSPVIKYLKNGYQFLEDKNKEIILFHKDFADDKFWVKYILKKSGVDINNKEEINKVQSIIIKVDDFIIGKTN
ncbi:MAG TPA: HNH endonuclease [Williamwhitmania sp.]|nr:HNH endonuclease [Williamwhitmania sp.]